MKRLVKSSLTAEGEFLKGVEKTMRKTAFWEFVDGNEKEE